MYSIRVCRGMELSKENVVMCRVYIPDVAYWDDVNEVYANFFGAHKPARVIVPCRELHHGALVKSKRWQNWKKKQDSVAK